MEKRGLSQVITVLLIILLSLSVISVLGVVVYRYASQQSEIAQAGAEFFSEPLDIVSVQFDIEEALVLRINIKKLSGKLSVDSQEIESMSEVDVISVVDLSLSMRVCQATNENCNTDMECRDNLGPRSLYAEETGNCPGVDSSGIPQCSSVCGGTLADGLTPAQDANKQLADILFENEESSNRLGLVAYSTTVDDVLSSDLTNDQPTLENIIDDWEVAGATCICCGINDGKNRLLGSSDEILKTIIVMSDGVATHGCSEQGVTGDLNGNGMADEPGDDAIQAACDAYSEIPNLKIYSIGLGLLADQDTLDLIATSCGDGQSFSASDFNDLVGIYENLGDEIIGDSVSISNFAYLKIIFYDFDGNSAFRDVEVPGPLETKNYELDLSSDDLIEPIVRIEIYPVIRINSGKEVVGPLADFWDRK